VHGQGDRRAAAARRTDTQLRGLFTIISLPAAVATCAALMPAFPACLVEGRVRECFSSIEGGPRTVDYPVTVL
jgi:hypothetical protein